MTISYSFSDLLPYINWPYFYFAWQVKDPSEKSRLRQEAESILQQLDGKYQAYGLFELFPAYSSGDDIVLFREESDAQSGGQSVSVSPPELGGVRGGLRSSSARLLPSGRKNERTVAMGGLRSAEGRLLPSGRKNEGTFPPPTGGARGGHNSLRIPCLRQQQGTPPYLCLSDFLPPPSSKIDPPSSTLGLFATSVTPSLESDFDSDPYLKMMTQLLADRLAEAAAERMHEQVRKDFWGYAKDEDLSIPDMLVEKFQGIRPAVGYPSLPDTSLNFIINDLIDMSQIGIRLTESGAMKPHASVSGLMFSHPQARYFSIGKIGEDQLRDYASRRGLPLELLRRFLASNL